MAGAEAFKGFIEEHKDYNLLDARARPHLLTCEVSANYLKARPRIHQLVRVNIADIHLPPLDPTVKVTNDLLELDDPNSEMDCRSETARVTQTWDPVRVSEYFVTDKLGILPRIAYATNTKISTKDYESKPLQICVTGNSKQDVDATIEALDRAVPFLELVQKPSYGIVVWAPNGNYRCKYRIGHFQRTDRATHRRVIDTNGAIRNPARALIPYPEEQLTSSSEISDMESPSPIPKPTPSSVTKPLTVPEKKPEPPLPSSKLSRTVEIPPDTVPEAAPKSKPTQFRERIPEGLSETPFPLSFINIPGQILVFKPDIPLLDLKSTPEASVSEQLSTHEISARDDLIDLSDHKSSDPPKDVSPLVKFRSTADLIDLSADNATPRPHLRPSVAVPVDLLDSLPPPLTPSSHIAGRGLPVAERLVDPYQAMATANQMLSGEPKIFGQVALVPKQAHFSANTAYGTPIPSPNIEMIQAHKSASPIRPRMSSEMAAKEFLLQEISCQRSTRSSPILKSSDGPTKNVLIDIEEDLSEMTRIHEKLAEVSESDTREFYSAMNLRAPNPGVLDEPRDLPKKNKEDRCRREAKKKDIWGTKSLKDVRGHASKAILAASGLKPKPSSSKRSSEKASKKSSKSSDNTRTVFHMLEPALNAVRSFPGRLTFEAQLGMLFINGGQAQPAMDLVALRNYFQPQSGLPAPNTVFNNRLATYREDIDRVINLTVDGHRTFERESFSDTTFFEVHCRSTENPDLFIVTISKNGLESSVSRAFPLAYVHVNFPENVWDAAIVLDGHSPYINEIDSPLQSKIHKLVEDFRTKFESSGTQIQTTLPEDDLVIERILMKRTTKYRYRREKHTAGTEDLYLKVTEVQDALSLPRTDKNIFAAYCALVPEMIHRKRLWFEGSLVSSAAEEALQTNSTLGMGKCTMQWDTAVLFGQGAAPILSSAATTSGPLIDLPGLWSLFGLTEIVVRNIDAVGDIELSSTSLDNAKAASLTKNECPKSTAFTKSVGEPGSKASSTAAGIPGKQQLQAPKPGSQAWGHENEAAKLKYW
ncbi:hypothetical protein N7532_010068 [Penicillium argentinense]|uniref:Uncharacterized protein n=1 Tax=Penicillium argentinense TaxID=1131581 RepID=A0A9W9ENY7_9EURO|nr:uncharacterized protein N7532_010068 [Penicillium argentinense]KAJ5085297.1 hypothetical protein N7532_010068 [Penicillium argentinense]